MELFICGNPRLLAGGTAARDVNYNAPPLTVAGTPCSTADVLRDSGATPAEAVARKGQVIHCGKTGYHNTPSYNVFLREGEWPSAGIELETHLKTFTSEFASRAVADLASNWFHFERDGSLDHDHHGEFGFELITEPLPPRAYRDQRLWTGLQNLCSPWLQSFQCVETGLHVHVGLNQFEGFDGIPFENPADRRAIGKLLAAVVYYCVADQAFIDRVALRKTTNYCAQAALPEFTDAATLVGAGKATGAALVDYCASALMHRSMNTWQRNVNSVSSMVANCDLPAVPGSRAWFPDLSVASGHGTEINQAHVYTVEFRRAKGTLHALSIHRIVELMTSMVRFAGKLCREPDFVATRESFMDWLIETTTSEALRNLAKQTKG